MLLLLAWDIVYYRRANGRVPVDEFLAACPVKVLARLLAVLDDVADAPPPQFSGGGRWEAMHGTIRGYQEVRIQGPGREQFRLFLHPGECGVRRTRAAGPCRAGDRRYQRASQALMTRLRDSDYRAVLRLGDEYLATIPRRVAA